MDVMTYNVGTDTYPWVKVISDVDSTTGKGPYVHFSGDGNRLLFTYYAKAAGVWSFIFFDPATGNMMGGGGFKKDLASGEITSKDCITMNKLGTKVYYILKRTAEITASLAVINFDGTTWTNFGFFSWNIDNDPSSGPIL
jgi:hypothetical protein